MSSEDESEFDQLSIDQLSTGVSSATATEDLSTILASHGVRDRALRCW